MVEFQPGLEAKLRSSAETRDAIRRNYLIRQTCLACTVELYCIADAKYYVCPVCRDVSPVFDQGNGKLPLSGSHGVGLGMTPEGLEQERKHIMGYL